MKKTLLSIGVIALLFTACKEQPVGIDFDDRIVIDTTYVENPESADAKKYLVEELTGVRCVNCPEGAEELENLNNANGNSFVIVAHHFGSLTSPIANKSTQDFRTDQGREIMNLIFGGQSNKPSVSFDRLPLSSGANPYFFDGMTQWPAAINQMKDHASTSPVNIKIESTPEGTENYTIHTRLAFTEAVDYPVNLHIYVVESDIWDGFIASDDPIRYDHVFRKALTPIPGRAILRDLESIEAGRVYEYTTQFEWDKNSGQEQFWKEENMSVIVFATKQDDQNKNAIQAAEIKLK